MEEINIKIPEELKELVTTKKINWQLVIGRVLKQEFEELSKMKDIVNKSKLTKEQAQELADEVDLALADRYNKLLKKE